MSILNFSKKFLKTSLIEEWELAAKARDIFIREIARAWMVLDRVEREISISRRKRLRTAIDAIFKWALLSGRNTGEPSPKPRL